MTEKRKTKIPTIREVPAVKRAVAILLHLANAQEPANLSQLARELEIIPSSCLHILRELAVAGLVVTDGNKTYGLGPRVLALANHYNRKNRFIDVARPHMEDVAKEFRVDVSAHESDGLGHIVVVASTEASQDVEIRVPLGHRFPLFAGASGRCIAAYNPYSEAELKNLFEKVRWQNPLSFERWREEVNLVKKASVGLDDGCYRKGLTTIATPVFVGTGPVTRFIGALGISDQLTATKRRLLADALKKASSRISTDLGGGSPPACSRLVTG